MTTTQTDDAVNQIVNAFAEVSLGNGVSLREADVIDDYGSANERAAARKHDEHHDWQRCCFPQPLGLFRASTRHSVCELASIALRRLRCPPELQGELVCSD